MFELLVAGTVGGVAGGLAWAIALWSGPPGSQRHRVVLLASFVLLFVVGSAAVMPRARAWKREHDVDELLATDPFFSAMVADEPALRAPLRASLLKALQNGPPGEALLAGQRLLSRQAWRYVPRASDASALRLGRAVLMTLERLQERDPEQCYRFLFPTAVGPPTGGGSPSDDAILAALRAVVISARDGSAGPVDRRAAAKQLDAAYGRLRERYGKDVDALKSAQAPGADRARVCAMTIALYSELVALPPPAAGQALRHVLGPAEPAAGR
jgi:hypothetical protein